ncbi:MAG: hypothetical protein V3U03_05500 [Myxococcota bacterium]
MTERLADQAVEDAPAEVSRKDKAAHLAREHQRLIAEKIRPAVGQCPPEPGGQLHPARLAGLRWADATEMVNASAYLDHPRVQVHVGPPESKRLADPAPSVRQEEYEPEVLTEVVQGDRK